MDLADGVLWPLATGPDPIRWAVEAAELTCTSSCT